ncbi:MAG: EamA family transporter [archaeon]
MVKKTILLMVACTFFTSIGQLFLKTGMNTFKLDFFSLLTNYNLIIGGTSYLAGAAILLVALKNSDLSIAYPMVSLSFVWVFILSFIFLREAITTSKMTGLALIFCGIFSIGVGSRK